MNINRILAIMAFICAIAALAIAADRRGVSNEVANGGKASKSACGCGDPAKAGSACGAGCCGGGASGAACEKKK